MKQLIGIVEWFNDSKGYGMLKCSEHTGPVFVHYTSIQGDGFKTLCENQVVTFDLVTEPKGPKAVNVQKTGKFQVVIRSTTGCGYCDRSNWENCNECLNLIGEGE